MHHVFVDYENTQPVLHEQLQPDAVAVTVFYGATMKSRNAATKEGQYLRQFGTNARAVKISGSGANALDFHIAFYAGKAAAMDPTASISIVSADTGFDPLIAHLRASGVPAVRSPTLDKLPAAMQIQKMNARERAVWVLPQIQPATGYTPKTLTRKLQRRFLRCLADVEVDAVRQHVEKACPEIYVRSAKPQAGGVHADAAEGAAD